MLRLRNLISHKVFIHCMVALGIFALWGYLVTNNKYILLGVAMSFLGAICGAFIKTIDITKSAK